MLSMMGVQVVSERTFFSIQRVHLWPAIGKVYQDEQELLLLDAQKRKVKLAGDGRADSPGYSAKFGTYSLLDVESNKILHFEVVQSNEVGGSCRMELAGLQRALAFLDHKNVEVSVLVTDRHAQVKCFMQKHKEETEHEYDVWHMAKGVNKKLQTAAKQSDCKELLPWIKSITNHMYWAAASSHGNKELIVPKWKSLLNHVQGIHEHDDELFPSCLHGKIEPREWLKKDSRALQKLEEVATARTLLKDMPRLSTRYQTYGLEAFHSLLLHFAPKLYHYPYAGMKARTQLAVLHYNENSERDQACTKDGTPRWRIKYPKAAGGEPVACPIMEAAKHGYVQKLLQAVTTAAINAPPGKREKATPETRSPLSSSFSIVNKDTEVAKRMSRFN
ncbi:uncharacterized protein LOC119385549 [Rhipicephalus sanguineus]|uniref:uncharacterized protein LOC119385549 n=1 Tax=Rhipicephalus sanguineus TaxID=34632 RepID=UPI0020C3DE67|nr:uncharacterized protein LOC119385549 [Rhipicephalus sanguineus]